LCDKSQKSLISNQIPRKLGINGNTQVEGLNIKDIRPSILSILTPQENSLVQVLTNQKRFNDL
jgi:hypothetical protein